MDNKCIFKEVLQTCSHQDSNICLISAERLQSVINASKLREDSLYSSLQHGISFYSHRNCLSTYTSKTHISRAIKKRKSVSNDGETSSKISRRSSIASFDFKQDCFFCADKCMLNPDPKHPDRWKKAMLCRTSDRGVGHLSFKEVVLKVS